MQDQFRSQFETELQSEGVPGGAWAIVHRGQILDIGTFGTTELGGNRAVDYNTEFRIASLSKGFSGVLAAMLAGERRISLDKPVRQYIPQFQLRPDPQELTVEDVLGQRSGFVRNAYDNLLEAGMARAEILPRFRTLEPLCPPGRCYSYQNNIFSLIEDVIEAGTGETFAQQIESRIFGPLGMAGASLGFEAFVTSSNRAEPHLKTRLGWRQAGPRSTYYQVASAAGINAGIVDMAQWANAMLGHRPGVIDAAVIGEVTRPRIRTRGELNGRNWRDLLVDAHYGLGWRIHQLSDTRLVRHGGWVAGYRAEISLSHDLDTGLIILVNAETRAVGELDRYFWNLAFDRMRPGDAPGQLTGYSLLSSE
ncbi:MAG: serine hydrolase domain-containing protein [Wenzhouxiangellaceae bacterium]